MGILAAGSKSVGMIERNDRVARSGTSRPGGGRGQNAPPAPKPDSVPGGDFRGYLGSARIQESVEGVRGATEAINAALKAPSGSCRDIGAFLVEVTGHSDGTNDLAQRMDPVTRELLEQANKLRDDVEQFRL
jgi:hypothetical protein